MTRPGAEEAEGTFTSGAVHRDVLKHPKTFFLLFYFYLFMNNPRQKHPTGIVPPARTLIEAEGFGCSPNGQLNFAPG